MNFSRFAAALAAALFALPAAAGTSLVIDANSGDVLSSENAGQPWHPASTTKMMTLYLALKAVRDGRIGLETAIPASKLAAGQPRVKVYIKAGQEITLDNAIRIMMVKSANDIAYVVAEGVGGDVPSFVAMMNAEAQRLGMTSTRFVNPNGWHHPDQQVSARDLAILAMALMHEFPQYADYWNTPAVQLGRQVLNNTNGLVGRYSGINGFKTGFVCASGFNVVATATRGGRTLIAVVLGSSSGAERTVKAAQLLDDGFGKWGGFGTNVAGISAGGGRAPNVCDEVRRRGGGAALADDVDVSGPISSMVSDIGGNAEGTSDRFPVFSPQPQATGAMIGRSGSGRVVLGPRAQANPIPVAFGRTPGSDRAPLAANVRSKPDTQFAGGEPRMIEPAGAVAASLAAGPARRTNSGNGAIPQATTAFAPASAANEAGPLRLQGAIQPGAATGASLRPGAAAGIRAAQKPQAKPALVKPSAKSVPAAPKKPAAKPIARGKPKSDGDA